MENLVMHSPQGLKQCISEAEKEEALDNDQRISTLEVSNKRGLKMFFIIFSSLL